MSDDTKHPHLNVVEFPIQPRTKLNVNDILDGLKEMNMTYILCIGWGPDEEGNPLIAASSSGDMREAMFVLEMYKHAAINKQWEDD